MNNVESPQDPIRALKNLGQTLKGAHERSHWYIAAIYYEASRIVGNPLLIERFQNEPFWVGVEFPKCLLTAAMRFAWDAAATNTSDYKTAAFNASALRYYFTNKVSAEVVYRLIREAGGIGPLRRDQLDPAGLSSSVPIEPAGHAQSKKISRAPGVRSQPKKLAASPSIGPRQFSRAWCEERLCLEVRAGHLDQILNLVRGAKGTVSFVAEGPDSTGFLAFRVTGISLHHRH